MATSAGLDLGKAGRAAGPKTLGLGSGQSSDRAGVWDLLKDSKPEIKLLQMVLVLVLASVHTASPDCQNASFRV